MCVPFTLAVPMVGIGIEFACETKLDRTVREAVDRAAHEANSKVRQQRGELDPGEGADLRAGCPLRVHPTEESVGVLGKAESSKGWAGNLSRDQDPVKATTASGRCVRQHSTDSSGLEVGIPPPRGRASSYRVRADALAGSGLLPPATSGRTVAMPKGMRRR